MKLSGNAHASKQFYSPIETGLQFLALSLSRKIHDKSQMILILLVPIAFSERALGIMRDGLFL